jgi:hypothetical protein
MAYRELGALPREHAYRIRPRPGFSGPGVMKVWDDPPPTTPLWQNRATRIMPRSGRPGVPGGGLLPEHYQALEGYDDGLGFSLKPPKWVRKLTLKKVVKPLLITAAVVTGAALIPGALPLLARGLVGAGKLAFGGVKLAGRGVTGLVKLAGREVGAAATVFRGTPQTAIAPQPSVETMQAPAAGGGSYYLPSPTAQAAAQMPVSAFEPGSTAPISSTPISSPSDAGAAPAQAGLGSAIVPLAVAGAALLAVTMMPKKGR